MSMQTDELNEMEINILRTLQDHETAGNRDGLHAGMIAACSATLGHPIDARLGDIGRAITGLVRLGLVRRFHAGERGGRQYRVTSAGSDALKTAGQPR